MCDLVARFAFYYSDLGGHPPKRCKPKVRFLRPCYSDRKETFELSSSRIDDDSHSEIEQEGNRVLSRRKDAEKLTLRGWVKFTREDIESLGIQLDPDDDPPGHVGIVGWPSEQSAQDQIAQALVKKCLAKVECCCVKLDDTT